MYHNKRKIHLMFLGNDWLGLSNYKHVIRLAKRICFNSSKKSNKAHNNQKYKRS